MHTSTHVLIVDQSQDVLGVFGCLVDKLANVSYDCVSSFSDLVLRLSGSKIDVVLLGLELPDSSGVETLQGLRALAPWVSIIVTGHRQAADVTIDASVHGAQGFAILEDLKPEHLRYAIKGALLRKEQEEALEFKYFDVMKAESRLTAAFNCMSEGFCQLDLDDRIVFLNPAAEELLGCRLDEVRRHRFHELFHFKSPEGVLQPARTCPAACALREGRSYNAEEDYFIRKDGTFIWVEYSCQPLVVNDRTAGGVMCFHDITGRKVAERRVNEFYSTISHELRTPLTSIRGSLGLIASEICGQIPDEVKEVADIAKSSCDRLARLIDDILDLKKIEAGLLPLRMESQSPAGLINQVFTDFAVMADHNGIELVSEMLISDQVSIIGDRDRLIQVLTNLVGNSMKFAPSASKIVTKVEKRSNGLVRFSVIDRGPGIAQDDIPKLFQKFQQIDQSDTRQKEGSGLGLAICRALVEQHGGTIGVDSEVGQGSCFWFELPSVNGEVSTSGQGAPPAQMRLPAQDLQDLAKQIVAL